MIVLYLLNIALRLAAVVWSILLLKRHRQWQLGLLTLMLACLTFELGFFAYENTTNPKPTDHTSFTVALGTKGFVSLLMLIAVAGVSRAISESTHKAAAHFRHLVDSVPVPVTITRIDDGTILYANHQVASMYGAPLHEIIGDSAVRYYVNPDQRQQLIDSLSALGGLDHYQIELVGFHGSTRRVAVSIQSIDHAGEKVLISAFHDITDRIAAEAKTRESEKRFRELFEKSPDAVFVESHDARILDVNPQACKLHGLTREQLIGSSVFDLFPEHTRPAVEKDFPNVVAGKLHQVEGLSLHADGTEIPVEINISHITHQQTPALLLHVRDNTARHRIENQFRESEKMLARAQEIADLGSFSRDLQTGTITASRQFYRIFGYDPARDRISLLSQILERVHPDDRRRVEEQFDLTNRSGVTRPMEYHTILPDGLTRNLLSQAEVIFDTEGHPIRMIGTVQDITELKRNEWLTQQNAARLRLLLEQLPAILWTTDDMLRFTSSVGAGLALLELQPDEVVGKTLYEYFQTDDPDHLAIAPHRRALRGQSETFEMNVPPNTFQVFIDPLRNADGEIIGTIGLAHDITERKQAERRQTMMMQELDHRVKNNLASVISIAEQSMNRADSLEEFHTTFTGRILAMARTHAALARTRWDGAELRDLIVTTIDPYKTSDLERVSTEGPQLNLPGTTALPLCMAIHELATNTVKYGALSNTSGTVRIDWHQRDQTVHLNWQESGGPPVTPPDQRGFGTRFIESGIAYQLQGQVNLHFHPTGVQCEIQIPLQPPH